MATTSDYATTSVSSANLKLDNSVSVLPQVSDARKSALSELGITNIRELINYFPKSYIDVSTITTIENSKIGFDYTIKAKVHNIEEKEPKPGVKLIETTLVDETGTMIATAFNQKWLLDTVKVNDVVAVSGKIEFNYGFKRMTNPYIHVLDNLDNLDDIAKVIPIHVGSSKISSSWIRNIIKNAFTYLDDIDDILSEDLISKYRLMHYFDALKNVHFPASMKNLEIARRTVKFVEVYLQQCCVLKVDGSFSTNKKLINCEFEEDKIEQAATAMSLYKEISGQSLLITSSDLKLAQYKKILESILSELHVTFSFIDENSSKENSWKALYDFQNGDVDVIIGTKALFKLDISPKNLIALFIDEKTEFSRKEIETILKKFDDNGDIIYLSSKPLTDSLSKLIYPGCEFCNFGFNKLCKCDVTVYQKDLISQAYDECLKWNSEGGQVAIFSPLVGVDFEQRNILAGKSDIENSTEIPEQDINYDVVSIEDSNNIQVDNTFAAKRKFSVFENKIFSECCSGLIHSEMSTKQKLRVLNDFENGKIDVLVCSTAIDFFLKSNSKLAIIVEDADRIGLSQLYQIRNFAIKHFDESKMYLICSSRKKQAISRLNLMCEIFDGSSLISRDLKMRREGSKLGLENWGFNALKLINIERDKNIIDTANKDAIANFVDNNSANINVLLNYEISRISKE